MGKKLKGKNPPARLGSRWEDNIKIWGYDIKI
jgi:hypothetical protein